MSNISNILRQQISERERGYIVPQKASFKRTKKLKFGALGITLVLLASIASAVLVLQFFSAEQIGNVPTPGASEPIALNLACLHYVDSGGSLAQEWFQLGSMKDLSIPIYLNLEPTRTGPQYGGLYDGIVTNGENVSVTYEIHNINTHTYEFIWNVSGVSENPEDEYYGFTYGVSNGTQNLDGVKCTILPRDYYAFQMWYKADPYYATPTTYPGESILDKINFESWIIS